MKLAHLLKSLCVVLCFCASSLSAQDVYYMEMGLGGGGAFYLGDENGTLFKNMGPSGELFFRYRFNGHWALKAQGEFGNAGIGNFDGNYRTTTFGGVAVGGEFNFFNYGVKYYESYSMDFTPYLYLGLGVSFFQGGATFAIPMAIGVKWKVADRINLGLTWQVDKLFSDKFDGVNNPLGLNKSKFVNQDYYSTATIWISFNFLKICAPCRNGVMHF